MPLTHIDVKLTRLDPPSKIKKEIQRLLKKDQNDEGVAYAIKKLRTMM